MELEILRIERQWGREPGWFYSLPKGKQVALMAEWRLLHTPQKDLKSKAKADKGALIRKKIAEYQNRDRING
jgi:hypothetical protein